MVIFNIVIITEIYLKWLDVMITQTIKCHSVPKGLKVVLTIF